MQHAKRSRSSPFLTLTLFSYCYYIGKASFVVLFFFYTFFAKVLSRFLRGIFLVNSFFSASLGNGIYACLKGTLWLSRPLKFSPPLFVVRSLGFFLVFGFIVLLPVGVFFAIHSFENQKKVFTESLTHAFKNLSSGFRELEGGDTARARHTINETKKEFDVLSKKINILPSPLQRAAGTLGGRGGKEFHNAAALIELGSDASTLGLQVTSLVEQFKNNTKSTKSPIQLQGAELKKIKNTILHTILSLDKEGIPLHYQDTYLQLLKESDRYGAFFDDLINLGVLSSSLAGMDGSKRYLVIFQNNTELRATGGFMGSFALIDVQNGSIKKMEVPSGGSYDLKGSLSVHSIPPLPLQKLIGEWQFQDANWFADFPTSAKKIEWFFHKSDGPTLDGIIAVNASFAEKILALSGPIEMPAYKKIITKDNVIEEIEKSVELEYDPITEKPKQFLTDLMPQVLVKLPLDNQEILKKLISLLPESAQTKEVQIYLTDPSLQLLVDQFNFSGRMKETKGDYLMVVHSNIGGRKTDAVIDESVDHRVIPLPDGSLKTTLVIKKTHSGKKGNFFNGVDNIDFVRIYVPQNATLLSASGFDSIPKTDFQNSPVFAKADDDLKRIVTNTTYNAHTATYTHNESGKSVFSGWVITPLGKTKSITLSYTIPPLASLPKPATYMLTHQYQSGVLRNSYTFTYHKKPEQRIRWTNRSDMIQQDNSVKLQIPFDRDILIGLEL